ncbi:MAG: lipoyl synthase [Chitinophagales bacterium]|nr:lipoyl synthase [Chitinophagales bacterium]MDW8419330.1 lipoyl synthase [Chitinophagales bacterium]
MNVTASDSKRIAKPEWLKIKLPSGQAYSEVKRNIEKHRLHTICESGSCPNQTECWGAGTATLMILGNICTRSCTFCHVTTGNPGQVDITEPLRVAESVKLMGLKHVVITSVDRDDLIDGGSTIWAATVRAIRRKNPGVTLETLIPDFKGVRENVQRIIDVKPEIVSHNIETVKRLTRQVRVQAQYERSLTVLAWLKEGGIERTKSGIMLGMGETEDEIFEAMDDLRKHHVDILTIGQYLQPTRNHYPVARYVTPDEFARYKEVALSKGFRYVESGPMVRSSYHAERHLG